MLKKWCFNPSILTTFVQWPRIRPVTLDPRREERRVLVAVQLPHAAVLRDGHRVVDALAAQETTELVGLFLATGDAEWCLVVRPVMPPGDG